MPAPAVPPADAPPPWFSPAVLHERYPAIVGPPAPLPGPPPAPRPAPADSAAPFGPAPDQLQQAFLNCGAVPWHDPAIAFAALDLDQVLVVGGAVDAGRMRRAVQHLARTRPYLVNRALLHGSPTTGQPPGPSGAAVGSGKARSLDTRAGRDADLIAKYPALQR